MNEYEVVFIFVCKFFIVRKRVRISTKNCNEGDNQGKFYLYADVKPKIK